MGIHIRTSCPSSFNNEGAEVFKVTCIRHLLPDPLGVPSSFIPLSWDDVSDQVALAGESAMLCPQWFCIRHLYWAGSSITVCRATALCIIGQRHFCLLQMSDCILQRPLGKWLSSQLSAVCRALESCKLSFPQTPVPFLNWSIYSTARDKAAHFAAWRS